MIYRLVILPEAILDINETILWYNEKQDGLGKRFWFAIKDELVLIKRNPLHYNIKYKDVRTASPKVFPYLIHFSTNENTIVVKAVYHTSRNSEDWNNL
jgi:hypothetical protein